MLEIGATESTAFTRPDTPDPIDALNATADLATVFNDAPDGELKHLAESLLTSERLRGSLKESVDELFTRLAAGSNEASRLALVSEGLHDPHLVARFAGVVHAVRREDPSLLERFDQALELQAHQAGSPSTTALKQAEQAREQFLLSRGETVPSYYAFAHNPQGMAAPHIERVALNVGLGVIQPQTLNEVRNIVSEGLGLLKAWDTDRKDPEQALAMRRDMDLYGGNDPALMQCRDAVVARITSHGSKLPAFSVKPMVYGSGGQGEHPYFRESALFISHAPNGKVLSVVDDQARSYVDEEQRQYDSGLDVNTLMVVPDIASRPIAGQPIATVILNARKESLLQEIARRTEAEKVATLLGLAAMVGMPAVGAVPLGYHALTTAGMVYDGYQHGFNLSDPQVQRRYAGAVLSMAGPLGRMAPLMAAGIATAGAAMAVTESKDASEHEMTPAQWAAAGFNITMDLYGVRRGLAGALAMPGAVRRDASAASPVPERSLLSSIVNESDDSFGGGGQAPMPKVFAVQRQWRTEGPFLSDGRRVGWLLNDSEPLPLKNFLGDDPDSGYHSLVHTLSDPNWCAKLKNPLYRSMFAAEDPLMVKVQAREAASLGFMDATGIPSVTPGGLLLGQDRYGSTTVLTLGKVPFIADLKPLYAEVATGKPFSDASLEVLRQFDANSIERMDLSIEIKRRRGFSNTDPQGFLLPNKDILAADPRGIETNPVLVAEDLALDRTIRNKAVEVAHLPIKPLPEIEVRHIEKFDEDWADSLIGK